MLRLLPGILVAPFFLHAFPFHSTHTHFVHAVPLLQLELCVLSVQFTSVQDYIYALGKAHLRSTPSLTHFPNVTFETVSMFV